MDQLFAISIFSSWDVGAGKELEEDALILPRPNTVLKVKMTFRIVIQNPKYPLQIVDLMKDRAKREASDQESLNVKDVIEKVEGDTGSGDGDRGMFARLVDVGEENEENPADNLDDPLMGNLSKRAINLSDLAAGGHQQRAMLGLQSLGERLLWDLSTYWWQLLLYLLLSFLLSLSWVLLLSCCAKPTVWVSLLISTIGLSLILAIHSYNRYEALLHVTEEQDDIFLTTWERFVQVVMSSSTFWLVLTIIFSTLAGLLSLTLGCCMQRIRVATEMISEASKAIQDIRFSVLLPFFPFLLHLLLVAWAVTVGLFLLSAREPQYRIVNGCSDQNCTEGGKLETYDSCNPHTVLNCSNCPEVKLFSSF